MNCLVFRGFEHSVGNRGPLVYIVVNGNNSESLVPHTLAH